MALEIRFPLLQVVGYQNSGKTTLVEKIVKKGTDLGYQIATIKHHGHQSSLQSLHQEKDSSRHFRAGASATIVEGGGSLQLEAKTSKWPLEKLIQLYAFFENDMIVIEGYKHAEYPKIVLIKREEDIELLNSLTNIVAVISWIPIQIKFPLFLINEEENYLNWIFSEVHQ
ncbi:molybdopterin-guanine dinucleotide biosynthesis protein B [Fredinandcohnia sp. QZ13]|uniref:molybdopterin-guanine dinucleotide biosynthesis protein B n=1 Tax=Fredinandcohnia sp. QZ13 TaxID=3073144 RepID=UPI0028532013|nr:molybdopterin-guanine dinucleotide biosynthesis protein B [Fredinandcohnia sp. QZ13]MDR4887047.1 molybdopterin-guanine dinucleotide biosynthesis protein B [Fredinandcohnia sp. QZ13]